MIIASLFFGASLSLSLLVLIMGRGWEKAKHQTRGEVLEFRKRGQIWNIRT
jgi:hypothetical protein